MIVNASVDGFGDALADNLFSITGVAISAVTLLRVVPVVGIVVTGGVTGGVTAVTTNPDGGLQGAILQAPNLSRVVGDSKVVEVPTTVTTEVLTPVERFKRQI